MTKWCLVISSIPNIRKARSRIFGITLQEQYATSILILWLRETILTGTSLSFLSTQQDSANLKFSRLREGICLCQINMGRDSSMTECQRKFMIFKTGRVGSFSGKSCLTLIVMTRVNNKYIVRKWTEKYKSPITISKLTHGLIFQMTKRVKKKQIPLFFINLLMELTMTKINCSK